jgi:hypothetical protein
MSLCKNEENQNRGQTKMKKNSSLYKIENLKRGTNKKENTCETHV